MAKPICLGLWWPSGYPKRQLK